MRITDIKQQVKRQDRYSIYMDGRYAFSLSEAELLALGIRIGQEVSEAELEGLKQSAVEDKAYSRSIDLLARRARSEWELRDYLRRKDYPPDIVEQTIQRLAKRGYINDQQFAAMWVDNRRLLKATSRRRLRLELKQKHIADDIIDIVLAEDETDERQVLIDLITKKRRQSRYQDEQKLLAYLLRQGYNYEDIKLALSGSDEGTFAGQA